MGGFFGKRGERVYKYGLNLASAALSGKKLLLLHDTLQYLLQSMMRLCGITCQWEAVNFLFGKVPETYITSYSNHLAATQARTKSAHVIVPELHATNLPARGGTANQTALQKTVEEIFEVNTM